MTNVRLISLIEKGERYRSAARIGGKMLIRGRKKPARRPVLRSSFYFFNFAATSGVTSTIFSSFALAAI